MKPRLIVLSVITLSLFGSACSRNGTTKTPVVENSNTAATTTIPRGLSFSPSAITTDGVANFFSHAARAGSFVSWAGPADDLGKPNGAPSLVLTQATSYHLIPIIIVSPSSDDLTTAATWKSWHDALIDFVNSSHVDYLGVGNEINRTMSDADLTTFGGKFPALVTDIHAASPSTKVFVTFQYEWLRGLRGGLFGGKNDEAQTQWSSAALAPFVASDLVVYTTYPGLIFDDPARIPEDYYTEIRHHTEKPIAFSEVGWFRTGPAGWTSSADEQAAAVKRFRKLTVGIAPVFSLWSFLYDPAAKEPFTTMGLLPAGEFDSLAWQAWSKQ